MMKFVFRLLLLFKKIQIQNELEFEKEFLDNYFKTVLAEDEQGLRDKLRGFREKGTLTEAETEEALETEARINRLTKIRGKVHQTKDMLRQIKGQVIFLKNDLWN